MSPQEHGNGASGRWPLIAAGAIVVSTAIAAMTPWWQFVAKEGNPAGWGMLPALGTGMLLLVAIINARRARVKRGPWLSDGETLGAFLILLAGGWTTTWAFIEVTMPLLTSPGVFGTPENGWVEHLLPHLPRWALGPMDEPWASGFYNGLGADLSMPWSRWLLPAAVWSGVAALLMLTGVALAGLVARSWIQHDRLTFPHAEVLLGTLRGWPGKRIFWWGAAIAMFVPTWNLVQGFVPVLPKMNWFFGAGAEGVEWAAGLQKIRTELLLGLLGLFYFVHRDIVLAMVVLFPLIALRDYGISLAGIKLPHGDLLSGGGGVGGLQTQGALLALAGVALWSSRHSLFAYVKAAREGRDDGWSWLSPRATLLTLAGALTGFLALMVAMGLRHPVGALVSIGAQCIGWIGTARVAAESAVEADWAVDPADLAVIARGTAAMAPAGLVALALGACWWYGGGGTTQLNNVLVAERIRSQDRLPKGLLPAMLAAVMLATAAAILATAWTGYHRGASTMMTSGGEWHYQWYMKIPYDRAVEQMRNPTGTDWARIGWLVSGTALMGILIWLRNNVIGWFIHPIGLILASEGRDPNSGAQSWVFTGVVAWLAKTAILRLGGVESYEKFKPFFGGLVLGGFIPGIAKLAVGTVYTLMKGHALGAM